MSGVGVHETRIRELDALRGIAAMGVLIYHYTVHYDFLHGLIAPFPWTFEVGRFGVHLFFVISGYVIFMTLRRTRHALDFAVSRFSRLFPAYWAAMLITLLFIAVAGLQGQQVTARDFLINLSMMTDFFEAKEIDGSYWTLQIELFFYIQMFFWSAVDDLQRIKAIIVAWLVLAAVYGVTARLGIDLSYTVRELLIVRYIPFFAAGILLFRASGSEDSRAVSGLLLGAAIFAAWAVWSWREALVLAVCIAVFTLINAGRLSLLSKRPLLWLGSISYTLYLLHQEIGFIFIAHLERKGMTPLASICIAAATVLLMATALTRYVERPAMNGIRAAYRRYRARPGGGRAGVPG